MKLILALLAILFVGCAANEPCKKGDGYEVLKEMYITKDGIELRCKKEFNRISAKPTVICLYRLVNDDYFGCTCFWQDEQDMGYEGIVIKR